MTTWELKTTSSSSKSTSAILEDKNTQGTQQVQATGRVLKYEEYEGKEVHR